MTDKKLQALTKKWKRILRLQDWRVWSNFAAPVEFVSGRNTIGECSVAPQLKQATINVRNDHDLVDQRPMNRDIESTLVHELLHIWFDPFTETIFEKYESDEKARESTEMKALEVAVEQLALAFVQADRRSYIE